MKKIFKRTLTVALSALLLASGLAMTVSARNTKADCAYGTAVVDGKLDAVYLNTEYTETIRAKVFMCPIGDSMEEYTQANYPMRATSYFCWDENYFYTCTIVTDPTGVFAHPREYYDSPWPWEDDGIEIWYVRNNESFSLHTDGSGVIWYAYGGTSGDKNPWADVPTVGVFAEPAYDNFDCTSKKATALTDDGYIIETALAIKDGSKYAAGDVIKCSLQGIDLTQAPENGRYGYTIGSQDPYNQGVTLTLAEPTGDVVTTPTTDVPETDILDNPNVVTDDKGNAGELVTDDKGSTVTDDAGAVVTKPVETKPAGSTTTTGGGNKNPNTSDMGIFAAAAVLVSGLAYATVKLTSKKRH